MLRKIQKMMLRLTFKSLEKESTNVNLTFAGMQSTVVQ
uniref:Uncharacterized protein n=1 Tax=Rhizophora mucronata TaxID=61149 RepID=A0A2P2IXA3_RHIMU